MLFSSYEFIVFFTILFLIRSQLSSFRMEKWLLIVASCLFYMSWNMPYLFLIVLLISMIDYSVGLRLGALDNPSKRLIFITLSIVVNVSTLAYFKYTNFILQNLCDVLNMFGIGVKIAYLNIIFPVGISFFTFKSMSYTVDMYRRHIQPCKNFGDYLLYVSFFPQLLAGPVVRAADFLPQLLERTRATIVQIETGLALFALGMIKKLVISDQIAGHVDSIFAQPEKFDCFTLLQGVFGYSIQIYCDFSGYTDMAIGSALILGYKLTENFRMPYSAVSIADFWRRWNITLSSWLRDYLYISFGGNRHGMSRTYINLILTMILGGLWHGATWNFVIWGAIHGIALAMNRLWVNYSQMFYFAKNKIPLVIRFVISHALTLGIVLVGWVFFRSQTLEQALTIVTKIITLNESGISMISPQIIGGVFVVSLVHVLFKKDSNWAEETPYRSVKYRMAAYSFLLIIVCLFAATGSSPFIYFQF